MAVAKKTEADDTVVGDEAAIEAPVKNDDTTQEAQQKVDKQAEDEGAKAAEEQEGKIAAAREEIHEVAKDITTDGVPVARAEKAILLEAVTKPTETIGDYPLQSAEEVQHRFNHRIYADYTPPPFPSPQV